jgi:hypothetical protein
MALTGTQYQSMRLKFRGLLSDPYGFVSEAELDSFIGQFAIDATGSVTAAQKSQADTLLASVLISPVFTPATTDVAAFFAQILAAVPAPIKALTSWRYQQLRSQLTGALSLAGIRTETQMLGYLGSFVAVKVPALFISGQSNAGNADLVAGTTDARVTFTWTSDGVVFTGPGAMGSQNANAQNGHSYEWQCSSDMAAAFNSNVLVGKAWSDGSTCDLFIRGQGGAAWPYLRNMIDNFARQCATAGLTQVAFIWDQGSSEALLVNAALTPNLTANTTSLFASIRAMFKAYGVGRVRFYVMQQNINFTGLSGIDTGQLNSVRAQETAIVAGDLDARLLNCDDIVMASGYHYASGQTNTIGSRFATQIAQDFTTAQPAAATPPTIESIFGGNLLNHLSSRSGIAVATGQPIPLWTDQSSGAHNATAAGSARPLYLANALGTIPGVQFDGVANQMAIDNALNLPAPGATPTWYWTIYRADAANAGGRIWGSGTGVAGILDGFGGANVKIFNGSTGGAAAETLHQFSRIEGYFSNSNAAYVDSATGTASGDYAKCANSGGAAGVNVGNTTIGTIILGTGATAFVAGTFLESVFCNALPTKAQFDALCGYYTFNYGTAVGST